VNNSARLRLFSAFLGGTILRFYQLAQPVNVRKGEQNSQFVIIFYYASITRLSKAKLAFNDSKRMLNESTYTGL